MYKGFGNFIAIYNSVITARILLSWFPQAQGIGILQPIYQITDPYLNLFRGIIPPVFGLDLSPILAFVTLDLLGKSAVGVAAEVPKEMREKLERERWGVVRKRVWGFLVIEVKKVGICCVVGNDTKVENPEAEIRLVLECIRYLCPYGKRDD